MTCASAQLQAAPHGGRGCQVATTVPFRGILSELAAAQKARLLHGACRFGSLDCPAAQAFLAEMTLPYEPGSGAAKPVQQLQQKSKGGRPRNNAASVIYGSALQIALHNTPATATEAGPSQLEQLPLE